MEKARRIGFLSATILDSETQDAFRLGLREHGYIDGQNLVVEWRFAEGRDDRLPGFATELVNLRIEVIVTFATSAAQAAKKATATIPIVFTVVGAPVDAGLVTNLARPGGNLTGFTVLSADITGKRLELFKEAIPSMRSIVILTDPANLEAFILELAVILAL